MPIKNGKLCEQKYVKDLWSSNAPRNKKRKSKAKQAHNVENGTKKKKEKNPGEVSLGSNKAITFPPCPTGLLPHNTPATYIPLSRLTSCSSQLRRPPPPPPTGLSPLVLLLLYLKARARRRTCHLATDATVTFWLLMHCSRLQSTCVPPPSFFF